MIDGARTDLTGYAALIGESFQYRVDLLERLLRSRHYPSLGTYKERLLAKTVRSFLPKTVEVGTGFILFPCEDESPPAGGAYHDPLNQSAYDVSRQCDIIVYDAFSHPPVFQDGDFVVLRPESVCAIIEVKGSLNKRELSGSLVSLLDLGLKWQRTQQFYRDHHQSLSPSPQLHCFCWSAKGRSGLGQGRAFRKQIADFYKTNVNLEQFGSRPMLHSLMIYNEWEISEVQGLGEDNPREHMVGWHSRRGRFVRVDERGQLFLDRDRTIASLLASLHWAVAKDKFNRFFSYADEVRSNDVPDLTESEVTWAWQTNEVNPIRRHNKDELPA